MNDYILWYGRNPKDSKTLKFRDLFEERDVDSDTIDEFSRIETKTGAIVNLKNYADVKGEKIDFRVYPKRLAIEFPGGRLLRPWPISNGGYRENQMAPIRIDGVDVHPPKGRCWSHTSKSVPFGLSGMGRVAASGRLMRTKGSIDFKRYLDDFPYRTLSNWWDGFGGASDPVYIVQTNERIVQRCILMATDPGDLVLDPTCGSGTTAAVAEHWGRRWITIDSSRVALALARTRIMSARYPYYLLADSPEGRAKEQAVSGRPQPMSSSLGDIRQGFVYKRANYITSGQIANNAEIDVIWERFQTTLDPLREALNAALGQAWEEWQIPREVDASWPGAAREAHAMWWEARTARQREIDASIARAADVEMLYDRPYADAGKVRVAGPFTVESLSPHRVIPSDDLDLDAEFEALDGRRRRDAATAPAQDFAAMVLENLAAAGVQGRDRADRVRFTMLQPWPGRFIGAEGRFIEGEGVERRVAILIGPEFGTLSRPDLVAAAREAADARFDVLVACAFAYDAHASELTKLGPLPILQAKMNPDLHMADDLKTTGKGNLFVVFGEPDIEIHRLDGDRLEVEVKGVDVFDPNTGDVRSDDTSGIAAWFVDTDYNEESFFVRHAYFLGANDPYKSLKASLKAEIDEAAWATLYRATSRPFARPRTGRVAVKVINHFGDEVMKVYTV